MNKILTDRQIGMKDEIHFNTEVAVDLIDKLEPLIFSKCSECSYVLKTECYGCAVAVLMAPLWGAIKDFRGCTNSIVDCMESPK